MKLQTTKKSIKNNYELIFKIPYDKLQYLFRYHEPLYFSAGCYGWSCDYIIINNVCFSTGYQPIGIKVDYELLNKYETAAKKVCETVSGYEKQKELLDNLINDFMEDLKNE